MSIGRDTDITSARSPDIATVRALHHARRRKESGLTILEGPHLLREALRARVTLRLVLALPDDTSTLEHLTGSGVRVRIVAPNVLRSVAATEHPRGPIAVIPVPPPAPLEKDDTLVMLGVADPGNAGTLIRSAAAFGFRVAVGRDTVDAWAPKVLRAAAGAHFGTPISSIGDNPVQELKSAGLRVIASAPGGGAWLSVEGPLALLVGNEPHGLDPTVLREADAVVGIATETVESLNAGVAGSILMYERARESRTPR